MKSVFNILKIWFTKIRKFFWLMVFTFLFFVFVSFSEKSNHAVECQQVVINIQSDGMKSFINKDNIYNLANIFNNGSLEGKKMQDIDLAGLESSLQQNSFIEDVEVYSGINGDLYIDLYGRQPKFRVLPANSTGFYVDVNGRVMPLSSYYTAHVPILTGHISKSDFEAATQSKYFIFIAMIEDDPFLKSLVGQIDIDHKSRITLVPKTGVSTIDFGTCDHLLSKFNKIHIFFKKILPAENWKAHKELIVKYKGQIILK